jgi:hypothetical protein
MQLTDTGTYKCMYCGVEHPNPLMAAACEKTHNVLYMPVHKEDLVKLVQFIYTGEAKLIPERLYKTIMKYVRMKVTNDTEEL